jgi:hypothetical protein
MLEGGDHLSTGKHGRSIGRRTPPYPPLSRRTSPTGAGLARGAPALVGRGWGGVFAPHQNPSRLPAPSPQGGGLRMPHRLASHRCPPLSGRCPAGQRGVPRGILAAIQETFRRKQARPDPTPLFAKDLPSNPPHITRSSQSIAWSCWSTGNAWAAPGQSRVSRQRSASAAAQIA